MAEEDTAGIPSTANNMAASFAKKISGALRTIVCGGIGGVSLWVAIFPADVVKSRIQVYAVSGKAPTFLSVFWGILRQEGVGKLYVGLGPTVVRTFPATGGLFFAYETTKKYMNQMHDYVAHA